MSKLQKQIILAAAVVLLGVFSWWFIKYIFYVGDLTLSCWIFGIILLILWSVALCLAMLLIENKWLLYGSFALFLVSFVFFFNNEPFSYLFILIIFFLIFWFACFRIRKEEKTEANLNFWKIWRKGLPLVITGLILVVGFIYYFSPQLTELKGVEFRVPKEAIDTIIKELPAGWLFGDSNEILGTINKKINEFVDPYKKFIPLGLAIGLVIGLKIISFVFTALVILFSWLILKLLTAIKFVKTEIVKKEVETVTL